MGPRLLTISYKYDRDLVLIKVMFIVCEDHLLRLYSSVSKKHGRLRMLATFSSYDIKSGKFLEEGGSASKILIPSSAGTFPHVLCAAYVLNAAIGLSYPYVVFQEGPPPSADNPRNAKETTAKSPLRMGRICVGHIDKDTMKFVPHATFTDPMIDIKAGKSETNHEDRIPSTILPSTAPYTPSVTQAFICDGPALLLQCHQTLFLTSQHPVTLEWSELWRVPTKSTLPSSIRSCTDTDSVKVLFFDALPDSNPIICSPETDETVEDVLSTTWVHLCVSYRNNMSTPSSISTLAGDGE